MTAPSEISKKAKEENDTWEVCKQFPMRELEFEDGKKIKEYIVSEEQIERYLTQTQVEMLEGIVDILQARIVVFERNKDKDLSVESSRWETKISEDKQIIDFLTSQIKEIKR